MAAQHPKPKSNILVRNKTSLRSCSREINVGKVSIYLHEHFLFYLERINQKANVIFSFKKKSTEHQPNDKDCSRCFSYTCEQRSVSAWSLNSKRRKEDI